MSDPIRQRVLGHFDEHERVLRDSRQLVEVLTDAARLVAETLGAGSTVFVCGNGGSAADAEHLVAELVGRFELDRAGLRAMTLPGDHATLTSLANDFGYEAVFERSLGARARIGDLLIAISTSGTSANVLRAVRHAETISVRTLVLTGSAPNPLAQYADVAIAVPAQRTARVQEIHGLCIHALVDIVEELLSAPGTDR